MRKILYLFYLPDISNYKFCIPNAIKDKIIHPFVTSKPRCEGTGLGLSLTYNMAVQEETVTIAIDTKKNK